MDMNIPSAEMVTAVGLGPVPPKPERLQSVDLVRGLVMILMALDHVRDFWSDRLLMDPTDLDTTTAGTYTNRPPSRASRVWTSTRKPSGPHHDSKPLTS